MGSCPRPCLPAAGRTVTRFGDRHQIRDGTSVQPHRKRIAEHNLVFQVMNSLTVVAERLPVEGGGTDVHWRAEHDGKPHGTGWFMRLAMVPYLSYLARKTAKVASRSD